MANFFSLRNLAALSLLLIMSGLSFAQGQAPAISSQPLTDNIHVLIGRGGNVGVLTGDDGTFLVDGKDSSVFDDMRQAIHAVGGGPVRYLFNTHFHGDHSGANRQFKQSGAVIIAHENVRTRLMSDITMSYFNRERPALGEEWLPEITFQSDLMMHLNGEELEVFFVGPAHTDGDAVVYFRKANVIHVGDIFFNKIYPFMDLDNGASFDGLISAIDMILARINEDTRIIPGHGPVSDYAGFKAYGEMLTVIMGRVRSMLDEGKSLEAIVAARPSSEFDETNQGFIPADDLVKFIYEDLKR